PRHRERGKASLLEAVRQGSRGWADDDRAFATGWGLPPPGCAGAEGVLARRWGFPLPDAACETRLWQGEEDVLVPRAHCAYLGERLPNARFELIPGAAHAPADHWRDILAWLAGRG